MRFSSVFFTLLFTFSTTATAFTTGLGTYNETRGVAAEGLGFQLTTHEIENFIRENYPYSISHVEVSKSFKTYTDPKSIVGDIIWRAVSFEIHRDYKTFKISCSLKISASADSIQMSNCSSTPEATVDSSPVRNLSKYAVIYKFDSK